MNIRGLRKFSLVDYPGKLAAIVFVGECNFRCPYCHNPCLVLDPESQPLITEHEFFGFLDSRKEKLDGVVISGGEPLLQRDLTKFCVKIKKHGFLVKLDTNGSLPQRLITLHHAVRLDSLGIDYKAPTDKYAKASGCATPGLAEQVRESIKFALDANIELDVRTTVHRDLLSAEDLRLMREELDTLGVGSWTLQQFNPVELLDPALADQPTYSDRELLELARSIGGNVLVRGLGGNVLTLPETN